MHGKNVYPIYTKLYEGEDLSLFSKQCDIGFLECKCGANYVRNIHSKLHHYDANKVWGTLKLKNSEVYDAAKQIAPLLFENKWWYGILRGWLCDDDSRALLNLEILQTGLLYSSFSTHPECKHIISAINTGISCEKWDELLCESRKNSAMNDFVGSKHLSDAENESIIATSRLTDYILGQYEYKDICTLHEGETFLDCGACFGDTAVWAMDKVGDSGTVVSFEPMANQAEILKENVRRHSALRKTNVKIENAAVSCSNGYVYFDECWGGSAVGSSREMKNGKLKVATIKIDDYCRDNNIRPSYIKMDIEGAEFSALQGAQETICKFRPRLAICVYHKRIDDLVEIPLFIKSCLPSYKLYLKKSSCLSETVLFAVPMN